MGTPMTKQIRSPMANAFNHHEARKRKRSGSVEKIFAGKHDIERLRYRDSGLARFVYRLSSGKCWGAVARVIRTNWEAGFWMMAAASLPVLKD